MLKYFLIEDQAVTFPGRITTSNNNTKISACPESPEEVKDFSRFEARPSTMHRVQLRVGAMLVMRRVYKGPDGSEIFALDESRSAVTTLSGLAFIKEWTTSPLSLLTLNGESLMRTCCRLPVGSGMHVDPLSSEMAHSASPVERRRHHEALAGGLKSIYMLHAGEDLVVKFASWVHGAFEGMEDELLEYAEEHLLRSSDSMFAAHLAHQTSVDISRELIRLRQYPTTPVSSYDLHGKDDTMSLTCGLRLHDSTRSLLDKCAKSMRNGSQLACRLGKHRVERAELGLAILGSIYGRSI